MFSYAWGYFSLKALKRQPDHSALQPLVLAALIGLFNVIHEVSQTCVKTQRNQRRVGFAVVTVQGKKPFHLANYKCGGFSAIDTNIVIVVADVEAITIHRRVVLNQRDS